MVRPLLKKEGLDRNATCNYWPISNLNTLSKVLERLALVRIWQHLSTSPNYKSAQSAYRRNHSTESTLLRTLDAAYKAMDRGQATLLIALDISTAFDTVVHSTLVQWIHSSYGVDGNILTWIKSYLSERLQFFKVGSASVPPSKCSCGVPQGSVLGQLFFTIYISPVTNVVESFGVNQQQYAGNTQLYIELSPNTLEIAVRKTDDCIAAVQLWFVQNGVTLNSDKSEAIPSLDCRSRKEPLIAKYHQCCWCKSLFSWQGEASRHHTGYQSEP